jgi:broad specificity phosphatase PhoE
LPLNIYFLRHGQTTFSRNNAFCGSGLDPDLTPAGQEMARAFAGAYQSLKWKAIYTSPLRRTIQTSESLSGKIGLDPERREGLKEIGYGAWEGMTVEEVNKSFHDDYIKWSADPAWNAPTGGEMGIMIARRAADVIEEIKSRFSDGNVLVVSHKATIRTAVCALLGIDLGRFRSRLACPVASVSIIEFGDRGPMLKSLADTSHLSEALRHEPGT